ncbi:MAG: outer membrane protein assembly factor BamA [Spirochaetes bacterium]|nr:outer membrane protein assembly factor BamA [Spirochaetota bacterium]
MKRLIKIATYIIFLTVILSFLSDIIAYKYEGIKIKKIVITGIINSDESKAYDVLQVEEGDRFIAKRASESIRALYEIGAYSDVNLDVAEQKGGLVLTFIVQERPIIKEIIFKGNDEFGEVDLSESIQNIVKEDDVYQEARVNEAINIILRKYEDEGYNEASVRAIPVINEETKTCKLIIRIREGDEVRVAKISIRGAKAFSEKKVVGKMDTHIDDWLHSGIFKQEEYERDKNSIVKFYKNNGYIFARVIKDKLVYRIEGDKRDKEKKLYITIDIEEGKQYKFGRYSVSGYTIFSDDEVSSVLEHKSGEIFNQEQFEEDLQALQALYGSRGYIFARIIPEPKYDKDKRIVSYNIKVFEGEIAHVENIIIRGNTKTKDHVIRREILIQEGEIFNSRKIQRSQEKVYNLGFFKNVKIDVRPGTAEGLMNLIFDVEEQMTGLITLGVMWGSVDGFGGYEEVSENNLMGRGIRIHERIEYQQKKQYYEAGFRHPYIFGTPISYSASIFYRNKEDLITPSVFTNQDSEFNKQEWGVGMGLGWLVSDIVTLSAFYNIELYQYYKFRNEPADANLQAKKGQGDFVKSSLTLKYDYDSRDNVFNPTRGFHFTQSWEITGGPLGGDDKYMKYITDASKYYPLFWGFVFVLHGNFGLIDRSFDGERIDGTINADDLLYIGGVESVRGYDYWETQWEDGGFSRIYGNIETRFPIAEQILWMVMFVDGGNLWRRSHQFNLSLKDYYFSTGWGFRIQIPMIPIRLYFSKRFHYDRSKEKIIWENPGAGDWEFDFSVGGLF